MATATTFEGTSINVNYKYLENKKLYKPFKNMIADAKVEHSAAVTKEIIRNKLKYKKRPHFN